MVNLDVCSCALRESWLSDSLVLTHAGAAFLVRDFKELLWFFVCSVEKELMEKGKQRP